MKFDDDIDDDDDDDDVYWFEEVWFKISLSIGFTSFFYGHMMDFLA